MPSNGLGLQTKSTVKSVDFFVAAHIDKSINWPFTYGLVQDKYSDSMGRPSIDPTALIRVPFIQYILMVSNRRQTIKALKANIAYGSWI
ncbi:MAG: transposase [Pseudoramibacter alactolyticus]|nr:transposase [Pseudoramibacter alactolyticus]